jgi:hypothetical protein
MLLLGLGHRARQGKDLAAESIKHYYDAKNAASLMHVASWKGSVRVGVFKYATALYAEVNEWLSQGQNIWNDRRVKTGMMESEDGKYVLPTFIDLPDWVQPEPNAVKSELAPYGKHPKLLQWWGTDYRRQHYGQDYWIKKLFATIPGNLHIALISDMRFLDEAAAIKERGGYTVNVQRLNADGTQYYASDRPKDHRSETELDGYDYDYFIKSKEGSQALTGEQAITLAEYLKALNERKQ